MRRALLMVAAAATLSVPASAAIVGSSAPAWASSGVTCGKLAGSFPGTVTFGKCTPKNKADKAATTSAASLATGGTLTWGPSGGTTTLTVSIAAPGQGACKNGSSEYIVTGSVTGGTSTYTHVGDSFSVKACVKGGTVKLLKGTTVSL